MKKRLIIAGSALAFTLALGALMGDADAQAAAKYTISAKTKPCDKSKYNSKTKNYYAIQSYLNKMKKSGGKLTLKKGTYKIPGTISVPAKVTITLKKGVVLKKTTKSSGKLKATKTMFKLLGTKAKAYKGGSGIKFVGKSKPVIDLANVTNAIGIDMAHNYNVSVSGIKFKRKKGGAYINVAGSKKVTISSNTFYKEKALSTDKYKGAVTLGNAGDTVNNGITIKSNKFTTIANAINTISYNDKNYISGINIASNTFTGVGDAAVTGKMWQQPTIKSNKITGKKAEAGISGIKLYTTNEPVISSNKVSKCEYAIYIDEVDGIDNTIGETAISNMEKNTVSSLLHYYVPVVNEAVTTRILYFKDSSDKSFDIKPDTAPYREHYTDDANYTANDGQTRIYYMLRSYMEQLEYAGGGTITLGEGTYTLSHSVCIPSNVTLKLAKGAEIKKVKAVDTDLATNKTMFEIVPPSKEKVQSSVGAYEGSKNVTIEGETGSLINCDNVLNAMGIIMGHAQDITLKNLTFVNEYGSHFIELNSSKNVKVENCSFTDFKIYDNKSHKEAINVDSDDPNNNGFNYEWAKHDMTTCDGVTVDGCMFNNMGVAVGTHTYSYNKETASQCYHNNVKITNCKVNQTYNAAIRTLNWKDCNISKNTFAGVQGLEDNKGSNYTCVLVKGAVNPTITENSFAKGGTKKNYAVIIYEITEPNTDGSINAGYAATVSSLSAENREALRNNTVGNNCYKRFITKKADGSNDLYAADGTKNQENLFKNTEGGSEE